MTDIFVVAGQSNAVGIKDHNSLQEIIAANGLDAEVVTVARGGTSMFVRTNTWDWYPYEDTDPLTGELTDELFTTIAAKLAEDPANRLAGILWVQGEADASYTPSMQYQAYLTEFHRRLVESFGSEFNFTVSQLSENMAWYTDRLGQVNVTNAQAAFVAASSGNVTLLDPDDAIAAVGLQPSQAVSDDIHFGNYGADAIGYEFLQQFYSNLDFSYTITVGGVTETRSFTDGVPNGSSGGNTGVTTDTTTLADGRVVTTVSDNGVRVSKTDTDAADAYNWSEISVQYASDGSTKVSQTNSYDNGRTLEISFDASGIRTSQTMTDGGDTYGWTSYSQVFQPDGNTVASRMYTMDDGRMLDVDFDASGVRTGQLTTDDADNYSWNQIAISFAADGKTKTSQTIDYDNGRTLVIDFSAAGDRSSQILTDDADQFIWASIETSFAGDGKTRIDQINSYDNGRVLDIDFDGSGQRTSQTMTDVDDVYAWDSYTQTFGSDGSIIDTVFTYDIA